MSKKRNKRNNEPFEIEIEKLGKKGIAQGKDPKGRPVLVKFAAPDGRYLVKPSGRLKGKPQARILEMLRPPTGWQKPACPAFGICGGCQLQQISLERQRFYKERHALEEVAREKGISVEELEKNVKIHPIRGTKEGYRYRNKVEFSFGRRRFLSDEEYQKGLSIEGNFLGFHVSGRFDRIVDIEECWLIDEKMNELLSIIREETLKEEAPPAWDVREHRGFWRHLMLRRAEETGELLAALFTAPTMEKEEIAAVEQLANRLLQHDFGAQNEFAGLVWLENDSVSDVARGEIRTIWGRDWIEEHLGSVKFQLSYRSFFQTSTKGAVVLYDTIAEALALKEGERRGTLYDLYSGIGSIGLYLANYFTRIVGVEEIAEAVEDARRNAIFNGLDNTEYHLAKMEEALETLENLEQKDATIVVDPPRAGLHPKVARALAKTKAEQLIYVACNPASLGRDAQFLEAGHWQLKEIWSIDLFPQTGHTEMVARFEARKS